MEGGGSEHSYAANSAVQRHYFQAFAKPLLADAVSMALQSYYNNNNIFAAQPSIPAAPPITIADLGCSYGPNALLYCSCIAAEIRSRIPPHSRAPLELLYYFSDLPSNDFNSLFASLSDLFDNNSSIPESAPPPLSNCKTPDADLQLLTAGVPGSFYSRLFPSHSLRLVVCALSLHWLSRVPSEVLDPESEAWNGGGVWLDPRRPAAIAAYLRQAQMDLATFLKRRSEEIASGGVLFVFACTRREEKVAPELDLPIFRYFEATWDKLVDEGIVTTHERDTFNVPIYFMHPNEFRHVLVTFSDDFELLRMAVFYDCCYPPNDAHELVCIDPQSCAKFGANAFAAVFKPMVKKHLGDSRAQAFFHHLEQVFLEGSSTLTSVLTTGNLFVAIIRRR